MKGGQEYEIRGRGDRDAFQITETGTGTVYAAVSMDPYHLDNFVRNDHWDYAQLDNDSAARNDPEAALTNLVEQMADGSHFDYDVTTYTAEAPYASSTTQAYIIPGSSYYGCMYGTFDPWCDGYYPSPSYFSLSIGFGGFFGHRYYPYGYGYGYGYPYGYGYGYGYPIYRGGYGRGGYSYGSAGYGYSLGRGWSYNHRPVTLGPGGGYSGSPVWGLGSRNSSIGYKNRGSLVSSHPVASPLYGVSRFNVQRSPSRGVESPNRLGGRREMPLTTQTDFRTRIQNTRPPSTTEMRPAPRNDGIHQAPTRVEPRVDSRPTRVEPRAEAPRAEPRAEPRAQPRAEPRSEPRAEPRSQPRAEPRSEPRARAPERSGGGGGGGGGGHHGGGGGGGRRP
jgi:hypothetical protein